MSIIHKIPKTLEFYPQVARHIESCWDSPECAEYIQQALSKDRFRDRLGFNFSVWFELKELLESSEYNQTDFTQEQHWQGDQEETRSRTNDSDEFQQQLNSIQSLVELSESFTEVMPEIEPAVLNMLKAVRITVFQCARNGKELVATFKSSREKKEIRVPYSPTSIAGYVALSQKPVLIKNLYQDAELKDIHPKLQFERSFSESSGFVHRTMICVPIKADKILLGVLQIINRTDGTTYSLSDVNRAMRVAQMIADKFKSELKTTQSPYDQLVQKELIEFSMLESLEQQARDHNRSVSCLLMEKGISEADIGISLERYYQVPYMGYQENLTLPEELFSQLKIPYLRKHLWLPIGGDHNEAIILLDDPCDGEKILEIQRIVNAKKYGFRVGTAENILRYLDQGSQNFGRPNLIQVLADMEEDKQESAVETSMEMSEPLDTDASPIVQLVHQMVTEAVRLGGSDIHIEPGKTHQPGTVRLRVDGECRELFTFPGVNVDAVIARIKVMAQLDLSQRRIPQDGKFRQWINGREVELRVATIPTVNGESAVLRLLAAGGALPLDKLNLSESNQQEIIKATAKPYGLFLVVGPTGSGKTTSLHAVLGHLNQPHRKIWTAEDPVEITQAGLQQVQVNPKVGFSFAKAIRAFLRADPDCILIGEMRDHETASIAIEASLTGHLVLSTLHTNSAAETITRLLDLGMEPINFSDALQGILAQRLVRTLCSDCKEAYQPDAKEIEKLVQSYGPDEFSQLVLKPESTSFYRAKGCDTCGGSGYRGRTAIHELLIATPALKKLIYQKVTVEEIAKQAVRDGMKTLLQDGIEKIFKGDIDYQQLLKVVIEN